MKNRKIPVKRFWSEIQWLLIGILWLLSLILGFAGFTKYALENDLVYSPSERFYRSLQLISMNSGAVEGKNNWMLEISRFALPALTAYTAFQAITLLFHEQMQWLQLWRLKNHIIVCGLEQKGIRLIDSLITKNKRVLAIGSDLDAAIKKEYHRKGVLILEGDAADNDNLQRARLLKASHLVCLHVEDRENLAIAHRAFKLVQRDKINRLTCIIHLSSQEFLNIVKRSELNLSVDDSIVFETFNIYDRISNQLINNDLGWKRDSKNNISTIIIIGFGRLGVNICQKAAYTWYTIGHNGKLNVIVIDRDAEIKVAQLLEFNSQLETVCNFSPIQIDLASNVNLKTILSKLSNHQKIDRIYICLSDPILSLQIGLTLSQIPDKNDPVIYIRLDKDSGLSGIIENPISSVENNAQLTPFDIYKETCTEELVVGGTHELLARMLNDNFQQTLKSTEPLRKIKKWEDLSSENKEANRNQASRIHKLLKSFDYHISPLQDWNAKDFNFPNNELQLMAQMEHDLWCQWKQKGGWKFGEVKDNREKTHPDLKPWDNLQDTEKIKNIRFIESIPKLLAEMGFQLEKWSPPPQN